MSNFKITLVARVPEYSDKAMIQYLNNDFRNSVELDNSIQVASIECMNTVKIKTTDGHMPSPWVVPGLSKRKNITKKINLKQRL